MGDLDGLLNIEVDIFRPTYTNTSTSIGTAISYSDEPIMTIECTIQPDKPNRSQKYGKMQSQNTSRLYAYPAEILPGDKVVTTDTRQKAYIVISPIDDGGQDHHICCKLMEYVP